MWTIVAGLAGVLAGIAGTFFVQWFYSRKLQEIAHLSELIQDIERVERAAIEYWLCEKRLCPDIQSDREVVLKGLLDATTTFYESANEIMGQDYGKYEELDGLLFDAVTGGTFETSQQVSDRERVTEIIKISNQLRHLIRGSKGRRFRFSKGSSVRNRSGFIGGYFV